MKKTLKTLVTSLQNLNYKYKIVAFKRKNYGVAYKSYNLFISSNHSLALLVNQIEKNEIFYDVGANYGKFTLPIAKKNCKVFAFEPNPFSFEKLYCNINANNLKNVNAFNIGLSNSKDVLDFFVSSEPARSSFHCFNATYGNNKIACIKSINVESIDDLLEMNVIQPPHYIKIDVEGHEMEVLMGAKNTIENHHPIIHLEPHEVRYGEFKFVELDNFFKQLNYSVIKLPHFWVCEPISG
ncbi:MAG: FkbM family methyltransferase [Clostridiales bacterium]|nr:FkbM family methyltransferase [Clostridiales bacterium]